MSEPTVVVSTKKMAARKVKGDELSDMTPETVTVEVTVNDKRVQIESGTMSETADMSEKV